MIPCEIFHDAFARRDAHPLHHLGMIVKMPNRAGQRVDVSRGHDDAFDSVHNNIARFARRDLRQPARRRFVSNFRAALAL